MKVHVDEERCEGHGRCYALAPLVFEPDDLGNGQAIGDGTVAPGEEDRARLAVANCPELAITIEEEADVTAVERSDDHPPVTDWATDFDHTDEAYAADPFPIWDELRSSGCPIAHTERYGGAWLPTTHEDVSAIAYDTERFTSRSVVTSPFRPPRRDGAGGHRAAHLVRPAVPQARPPPAAPRLLAAGHRQARAGHPRLLRGAHRGDGRPRRRRRRRGVRPAHPRAGDRQDARLPRGGRRSLPRLREPRPRGRGPPARAARRGDDGALRVPARAGRGPHRQPPRRPHHLPAQRGDGRRADPASTTPSAPSPCCSSPASTPPGARSARRSTTSPPPRPTASASSPSPSCCRPRWRSCSAPTPPSPWPAW